MDDLAHYIGNRADMPVVNRTVLSGLVALEGQSWRPMRLPPRPPEFPRVPNFDDLPTVFTVLGKPGLELKRQEATVPIYYGGEHVDFYRANGFVEVGRGETRLTTGRSMECVFMRKDLGAVSQVTST